MATQNAYLCSFLIVDGREFGGAMSYRDSVTWEEKGQMTFDDTKGGSGSG